MNRIFRGFYINRFGLGPLHYISSRSDFSSEFAEIFVFEKQLPVSVSQGHKVRTYKEYHSVCPSSELGLPPTPHPHASVPPPPCFWGEGNTRWRERGWESPNSN